MILCLMQYCLRGSKCKGFDWELKKCFEHINKNVHSIKKALSGG